MKKEIIEKYIQFAIDNGYKDNRYFENDEIYIYLGSEFCEEKIDIIRLIASKEFIEAIARGLIRQRFSKNALEENIQNAFKTSVFQGKVKELTHNQADAIRDLKLEEFILSIIK